MYIYKKKRDRERQREGERDFKELTQDFEAGKSKICRASCREELTLHFESEDSIEVAFLISWVTLAFSL
jgi:hypothetical protein